jgi:hypothetical protein
MSDGISAMWDDAEHYEALAKRYNERVRLSSGGLWPYNMDSKHYEELKKRRRLEKTDGTICVASR